MEPNLAALAKPTVQAGKAQALNGAAQKDQFHPGL
jgi:hypothetical protein